MNVEHYSDSPAARRELFQFYREAYPDSPWLLDPDRFEWQACRNPLLEKDSTEIWLLKDGDRITGQNIYLPYELSIGGTARRGFCSTNLIVRPEYVGKGIGHKLIALNEERPGIPFAVGITKASERAFLKRSWVLVTDTRLYTRVLRPHRYVKFLRLQGLRRPAGWFALVAAKAIGHVRASLNTVGNPLSLETEPIRQFESSDDGLWNSFLQSYAIHFRRQAEMLNYKYFSRPDVDHTAVVFKIGSKKVGYVVYRLSRHPLTGLLLGRIVDVVYDPNIGKPLARAMIQHATQYFRSQQVDGIVGMGSNNELAAAMRESGFILSRPQHAIIKETEFSISDLRARFEALWYITLGDSDLDNYW